MSSLEIVSMARAGLPDLPPSPSGRRATPEQTTTAYVKSDLRIDIFQIRR